MKPARPETIKLGGRRVDYRLVTSRTARMLRVRVGPNGMEVLKPAARQPDDVTTFLRGHETWILDNLQRADSLRQIRRRELRHPAEILFRGKPTKIRVDATTRRGRENRVFILDDQIIIQRGPCSRTPPARSLENWLRKHARQDIGKRLATVTARLKREPHRVYVMGQRTKWGNCSRKRNLSFNWRLIMAPPEVLNYIVTHEVAHLVEPYHSPKFWLLLRSHCPRFDSAKNWLHANHERLLRPIL
jgi:predicted metal-dependent hydrolase